MPFRVDDYRFRRQSALEKEVEHSPLFRRGADILGRNAVEDALHSDFKQQLRLAPGVSRFLDKGLSTLKRVARLPYTVTSTMTVESHNRSQEGACLHEGVLHFCIGDAVLQRGRGDELRCLLATATMHAHMPFARYLRQWLIRTAPLEIADRVRIMEVWRLARYAAACFAYACCGSTQVVARAVFARALNLNSLPGDFDLWTFASQHALSGELSIHRLLERRWYAVEVQLALPLVLDHFARSELAHRARGQLGGIPSSKFETDALEVDKQVHRTIQASLSPELTIFCAQASHLACLIVRNARGCGNDDSSEPIEGTNIPELDRIPSVQDRDFVEEDECIDPMGRLRELVGRHEEWASTCCFEILRQPARLALKRANYALNHIAIEALRQIAACYGITDTECTAVLHYLSDSTCSAT